MKNGKIGKICLYTTEQEQQFHRKIGKTIRISKKMFDSLSLQGKAKLKFTIRFAAMKSTKIDKIEKLQVL